MNPPKKLKLDCVFRDFKCDENVISVNKLTENITNVRTLLPESKKLITERSLIENRAQIQFQICDYICAYHRGLYGNRFSTSSVCKYPEHKKKKRNGVRILRTVPLEYVLQIPGFIIGNKICLSCNFRMKETVAINFTRKFEYITILSVDKLS